MYLTVNFNDQGRLTAIKISYKRLFFPEILNNKRFLPYDLDPKLSVPDIRPYQFFGWCLLLA